MLFGHGLPKLLGLIAGRTDFADPIGLGPLPSLLLAVFAEFLCSLALILGVKTRWATVPLLVTMAVAALVHHTGDPWARKELAVLYAVAFLCLLLTGPGRYSWDELPARHRR